LNNRCYALQLDTQDKQNIAQYSLELVQDNDKAGYQSKFLRTEATVANAFPRARNRASLPLVAIVVGVLLSIRRTLSFQSSSFGGRLCRKRTGCGKEFKCEATNERTGYFIKAEA
jgi:hypothetical protein